MAIPSLTKWRGMTVTDSIGGRSPEMGMIEDQIRAFAGARGDRAGENTAAYAGYAHERRQFLNEGKQQSPVSASALRDTALADAPHGTNPHTLISQMDDDTWDGYARPGGVMRSGGSTNEVLFFDKQERLEHMLIVVNGLLLWARDNSPCTTPADQPFMFAMDGYGNLFARADNLGASQFNHSSFNAGREVVCAGMIAVAAGLLHFISNESGHYQPDRGALFSCVQKLRQQGTRLVFPRVAGWRRPTDPAEA